MDSPESFDCFEYAGFFRRALAAFIDALILMILFFCFIDPIQDQSIINGNMLPALACYLTCDIIILFMVIGFAGTPGKMVLSIRIVNGDGCHLSVWRAFMRQVGSGYFIGSIISYLMMSSVVRSLPLGERSQAELLNDALPIYGGIYWVIGEILHYYIFLDVGFVLFNKKKRAIHDYVAGSYVVTKESYKALKNGRKCAAPKS